MRFLAVGLGNPEGKYFQTFHNLGFAVAERVAERLDAEFKKRGNQMLAARDSIIVLKPLTYMNASGQAVLAVARKHMIPAENIVVVCDDLYIEKGKIRISSGGSGGGHNGLKSVTELLGTADYKRVRVGIMPAQKPDNQKDYVLSRIEPADAAIFETAISNAAEAVWEIIHGGKFEIVQGKFNAKNAKSDGAK